MSLLTILVTILVDTKYDIIFLTEVKAFVIPSFSKIFKYSTPIRCKICLILYNFKSLKHDFDRVSLYSNCDVQLIFLISCASCDTLVERPPRTQDRFLQHQPAWQNDCRWCRTEVWPGPFEWSWWWWTSLDRTRKWCSRWRADRLPTLTTEPKCEVQTSDVGA